MIEVLSVDDFDWISEIHRSAFDKELSTSDLKTPYKVIGIKNAAYTIYTEVLGEAEIIYIAVGDAYRRKGLAEEMLKNIDADIFLEVNENNLPAINLYKKCGFNEYMRRKNYYKDGDAILMKYERK